VGARRRCCCDCYFVLDTFPVDGADVNAVDPYWEECEGDWEIVGSLLTTEDAGAVCVFKPMVGWPVGIFEARVIVNRIEPAVNSIGGTAQMFAYIGTEDTPCGGTGSAWRLELEILSSLEGTLTLYNPADEVAGTRQVFFPEAQTYTDFWICVGWDPDLEWGVVKAGCDEAAGPPIWACHQGMPTYYFALGNKSAAPDQVFYDEAYYIDQYNHDARCPDCDMPCCCPCIEQEINQPTLTATVVPTYGADCYIGGESTTLECNAIAGGCCIWASTVDLIVTCKLDDTIELELSMECLSDGSAGFTGNCEDYKMTITLKNVITDPEQANCFTVESPASSGPVTKGVVTENGVVQCDCMPAFWAKFGPFYLWKNPSMLTEEVCYCCKEFSIVVTQ